METFALANISTILALGPHSLGQSVEWKLILNQDFGDREVGPHSLGQSVEWKPVNVGTGFGVGFEGWAWPHSLGQSVEWKPQTQLITPQQQKRVVAPLAGAIS